MAAASLVFDSDGKRVARYDKIHLFDVDIPGKAETYRESAHVAPGTKPAVVDTPAGKVGLSVCYDIRFPELFRQLSAAGAQILTVPSAFTGAHRPRALGNAAACARHRESLLRRSRLPSRAFTPNGRETYGDSMIVDHWGRVLQRLPRGRGVVVADVDLVRQAEARTSFPSLTHRML